MNLDELERLAKAATPGPWGVGECAVQIYAHDDTHRETIIVWEMHSNREANAAFIASANPAVILALIERVRKAETNAKP